MKQTLIVKDGPIAILCPLCQKQHEVINGCTFECKQGSAILEFTTLNGNICQTGHRDTNESDTIWTNG